MKLNNNIDVHLSHVVHVLLCLMWNLDGFDKRISFIMKNYAFKHSLWNKFHLFPREILHLFTFTWKTNAKKLKPQRSNEKEYLLYI